MSAARTRVLELIDVACELLDEHGREQGCCLVPPRSHVCTHEAGHEGECALAPNPLRAQ